MGMKYKTALRKYMKHSGLSANAIARSFGVTRRTVLYWRAGTHEPPAKSLARCIIMIKEN
jgi:DNA-binding transcriptional regulator YiaG